MRSSKVVMKIVHVCFVLLVCVTLMTALFMLGHSAYDFGYRIFAEPAMSSDENAVEISVQITEGMSLMDIAKLMEEKDLSRSSMLFYVQLQLSDYRKSIKPGLYTVDTSMTASEIITCLGTQSAAESGETGAQE